MRDFPRETTRRFVHDRKSAGAYIEPEAVTGKREMSCDGLAIY